MAASFRGHLKVVIKLLKGGASPDLQMRVLLHTVLQCCSVYIHRYQHTPYAWVQYTGVFATVHWESFASPYGYSAHGCQYTTLGGFASIRMWPSTGKGTSRYASGPIPEVTRERVRGKEPAVMLVDQYRKWPANVFLQRTKMVIFRGEL